MNQQQWADSFREKLNQHYRWPSPYMFKFIVPSGQENAVRDLFSIAPISEKASANGKYTSVTFQLTMHSADAVIEIYITASKIEGLIAL